MYKTDPVLVEKCRTLRRKGFTLGEIIKVVKLPKTTIFDHIQGIPLSFERKKELAQENIRRLKKFALKRKRIIRKPRGWTKELISLVAHFMFDGEINRYTIVYHNRNNSLINQVMFLMKKIFNLEPWCWLNKETGVHRIYYWYVELANYIAEKAQELKQYIRTASLSEKKIFLQTFFDDEGNVHKYKNIRSVRGFQHNLEILKLVQNLLKDFDIKSKIDEKYQEIIVSRKPNIIKFRDEINFSNRVFINPARKNSIWKKKLEKREILNKIINSYQR